MRRLAGCLAVVAAISVACGGERSAEERGTEERRPPRADAKELVADAARMLRGQSTFRFTVSYTRTRADRPREPERYAEGDGALDLSAGRGRLTFRLDLGLGSDVEGPYELRWTRDWLEGSFNGERGRLSRARARESAGLVGRLPDEPESLVELLEEAREARSAGEETVGGEATTVIRFVTDARDAGRAGVPAELNKAAASGGLGAELPMEVWLAGDGLPRVIAYEVRLAPQRHQRRLLLPARTVRGEYRLERFGEPFEG